LDKIVLKPNLLDSKTMGRSRKLTLTDWTAANNALMQYFEGNKSKLAGHLSMSRTTINDFFNERPVGESSFRKICLALRLRQQQVSSPIVPTETVVNGSVNSQGQLERAYKIEVLIYWQILQLNVEHQIEISVEQIRQRYRQKILDQHSRIRLLSGEEIGVDQLYVDVWLLGKPEHRHFNTPKSLLSNFDIENDRLALSKRLQRNPGFGIANSNPKLVILGKPGSGKTTFLKHLAIDWCKGKFQSEQIAVLIELRQIKDSLWNIWSVIGQELGFDDWQHFSEVKEKINKAKEEINKLRVSEGTTKKPEDDLKKEIEQLEGQLKSLPLYHLLEKGRLLILMDGLDELTSSELRHSVQLQLRVISQDYPRNRFILTCRTQIIDTIPTGFTSVEVADFNPEQVRQFVQNWFTASGQSEAEVTKQWETIQYATTHQSDLKELTVTPVLLSLICLVLQDERGEMPADRGWLYKKGIKLLLSRWNNEKAIKGWEIGTEAYRQLSIEDKEALLIEIAARKFEDPKNFVLFEQDELVEQIIQILQ
jgi:predicted NACHT family NTPase